MLSVARRFGIASAVAIAVLLATGIAMASHYSRWEDDTLKAKLAVLVLVAVLTRPAHRLAAEPRPVLRACGVVAASWSG